MALRDFEFDFVSQYRICDVSAEVVSRAMALARAHPLKGYDAVQLASASVAHEELLALGYHITFVSADRTLNHAARAEGLSTDNPNDHP
jgi:predicted nucleic acid-binding protein